MGVISLTRNQKKRVKLRQLKGLRDIQQAKRAGNIPFADPVAAISEQIHSRSFSARAPKMFDLVDGMAGTAEDRAGAAHECAIALRQHAGVPFFGKSSHSMWAQTVTDWTDGT